MYFENCNLKNLYAIHIIIISFLSKKKQENNELTISNLLMFHLFDEVY